MRRNAQAKVHLFERLLVAQGDARVRVRRLFGRRRRPRRQRLEIPARQAGHRFVFQVAGRGDDQVGRRVDGGVVIADGGLVQPADGVRRAQNRLAQRVILPEVGGEDFLHQVIRAVLLHLDLFQDDALFLFDVLVAEERVKHQVGQHVEGARQVLVENLGVEAHQLLAGEGVQVAADRIHRARDLLRRAIRGALEQHVLDEVGDAVAIRGLAPRAGGDPHAHRNRAHVRHSLGNDAQAIGERGGLGIPEGAHRRGHEERTCSTYICNIVRRETVNGRRKGGGRMGHRIAEAVGYRSSGRKPVCFAISPRMTGPNSSLSW